MIAKRIETSRARLDNPSKPIGVVHAGRSVRRRQDRTALALAETLYGGEQNMITINMSEFQEAHTVSLPQGRSPRLRGLWRRRRLTEAGAASPTA